MRLLFMLRIEIFTSGPVVSDYSGLDAMDRAANANMGNMVALRRKKDVKRTAIMNTGHATGINKGGPVGDTQTPASFSKKTNYHE